MIKGTLDCWFVNGLFIDGSDNRFLETPEEVVDEVRRLVEGGQKWRGLIHAFLQTPVGPQPMDLVFYVPGTRLCREIWKCVSCKKRKTLSWPEGREDEAICQDCRVERLRSASWQLK